MIISVALCTYNGEKFIKEQIDSILNQTFPVDEIIICDDCSSDSTVTILEEYKGKKPELFKIHKNETNLRSNKNFEKAISLTTGDYIFLSDQDDIWRNDKVEKIMNVFSKNEKAQGVFSDANFIDENSELIHQKISLWESVCFFHDSIKETSDLRKSLLHTSNFLTGATLCIKKEVKEYSIPFLTIENFIHDEWFAYVLTQRNALCFSTEKLISYRLHNNQQLGVGKIINPKKLLEDNRKINSIMMGLSETKKFNESKSKVRFLYYQYEKYFNLHTKYNLLQFKEIYEDLRVKFIESNNEMKSKFPIFYFFRRLSDKKKGKRQIKNYIDNI